jgi:hypothetical protein
MQLNYFGAFLSKEPINRLREREGDLDWGDIRHKLPFQGNSFHS